MNPSEFKHIIVAAIISTVVISLSSVLNKDYNFVPIAFILSVIIIGTNIIGKKISAYQLDSDIEHELWFTKRFGIKPKQRFPKPIPVGIILPILISIFSLGTFYLFTFLTYESRALKHRAAKRFGYYSYTEMSDMHNALIGAGGIIALILLAIITYLLPFSHTTTLSKLAIYYAFWNLVPISKLDGTQILIGSRVLWTVLASITTILTALALITY